MHWLLSLGVQHLSSVDRVHVNEIIRMEAVRMLKRIASYTKVVSRFF